MTTGPAPIAPQLVSGRVPHGFTALLRNERRLLGRDPAVVVFAVLLPLAADVVLAVVPATREPSSYLGGVSFSQVYLPVLVLFVSVLLGVQGMPTLLTQYRESGILHRLRATPVSPAMLLAAVMTLMGTISAAMAVLLVAIPAATGAGSPRNPWAFAVAAALSIAASLSIGALVAALAPTSRIANGIGTLLMFVLAFFAGLWIPRTVFPPLLDTVAGWTPTGATSSALLDAMRGSWPGWQAPLVVCAYCVVASGIAVRTFRWD